MNSQLICIVLLASLSLAYATDATEESRARLLVSKQILNKYLVENRDVLVKYSVFNVGNGVATHVSLTDHGFPHEAFDLISGKLEATIDRIAPATNVSHVIVVRPKAHGYFNFTAAEVSYRPVESSPTVSFIFAKIIIIFVMTLMEKIISNLDNPIFCSFNTRLHQSLAKVELSMQPLLISNSRRTSGTGSLT